MMKLQVLTAALAATVALVSGAGVAVAAEHPYYLHALTDLKRAELVIASRHGSNAMSQHEHKALQHVQAAQNIIYQVAPEEKKNVDSIIAADADPALKAGKLHDALAFLKKSYSDMNEAESDTALLGQRKVALEEVDGALYEVNAAITDYNDHK